MGNLVSSSLIQPQLSSRRNTFQFLRLYNTTKLVSLAQPWIALIQILMSLHMHIGFQPTSIEQSLMQKKNT